MTLVAASPCRARAQDAAAAPTLAGSSKHVSAAAADGTASAPAARSGSGAPSGVLQPVTGQSGALAINATFDTSITSSPDSAAIQAMINDAIDIYRTLLNDPITVSILFRYSTTAPDGSALSLSTVAQSTAAYYTVAWSTYIGALAADATTASDATANASLPGGALSTNILPASAAGRAVGLDTPPALFANGSVGVGGPFDGIVTLNANQSFTFTRPPTVFSFDAQRATEHEIDEVLGLGSYLNIGGSDLRPQDLFSWSAAGVRNLSLSGSRYLSIDGGTTNLVGFNQTSGGDFGDWLSESCPQAHPYVQNAFGCTNQAADVLDTSPEGINLDVIGYDLLPGPPTPTPTPSLCGMAPAAGCDAPSKGGLLIKNTADDSHDKILWKWIKGPAAAGFGDPLLGGTSYALCIYDDGVLQESFDIAPGANWSALDSGFAYKDPSGAAAGVTALLLKGAGTSKAKIALKGKGATLPQPTLPFAQASQVTVQLLRSDDASCWETVLVAPATKTSDVQFKDKL